MGISALPSSTSRNGVARPVYLAAVAMVVAFVGTIVFVIETANREADRFALHAELRLTRLEFGRLTDDIIRAHSDISYWDDAVEAFSGDEPDLDFIEDEIAELTIEHGFEWAAVVGENGEAGFAVIGEQLLDRPANLPVLTANRDLVEEALALYHAKRVKLASGYIVPAGFGLVVEGMQATGFRIWNGRPGLVVAQVILPETEAFALQDGKASVLLAFKPVSPQAVGRMLGLMEPRIVPAGANTEPRSVMELPNGAAPAVLAFQWKPRVPRFAIMRGVVPPAVVLCGLICAVMLFMVRRHGRTLHALAESEERNRIMATHDALTGLPNRTQFDDYLDDLLAAEGDSPVAVMCVDLDRFKIVNDTYGHHAGDAVLRAVATRFRERIGDDGMVARIGGDEFIVALTQNVDRDYLNWLGDGLVEDASQPVAFQGHELAIGASIGIAIWPQHGRTAREVITAADQLLYRSKGEGRGRATVADSGGQAPASRLNRLAS